MLDGVQGIEFGYILCGIIMAITFGFAAGNYACSLVHRLPRGRLILDKKPYCGHCGTLLQVRDLFPVFSALMLRHRCRYCKEPFPVSHTWTEVLVGLLFVLCFLQYNYSEQFLLITLIGIFLIILAAIQANEQKILTSMLLCIALFGALFRTLQDGTIYNFSGGAFYGLMAGVVVWRKHIKPVAHIYSLPIQTWLLVIGGLCIGLQQLPAFFALYAMFYALCWLKRSVIQKKPVLITVPFGFAVMVLVMYPGLVPTLLHLH